MERKGKPVVSLITYSRMTHFFQVPTGGTKEIPQGASLVELTEAGEGRHCGKDTGL